MNYSENLGERENPIATSDNWIIRDTMHIYKELILKGNKTDFDEFKKTAASFAVGDWKFKTSNDAFNYIMRDFITFDYLGKQVNQAAVSIHYEPEHWQADYIKVSNIVPLKKRELTIKEYNAVLDLFYNDIIIPYINMYPNLHTDGPTSDQFDPLSCISETALEKLESFCNAANKSTGSHHPCDEERWFDFICQTVEDERLMDYSIFSNFLMDEEYWGKPPKSGLGGMGRCAWSEEQAQELALEYEQYVNFLQYYKKKVQETR